MTRLLFAAAAATVACPPQLQMPMPADKLGVLSLRSNAAAQVAAAQQPQVHRSTWNHVDTHMLDLLPQLQAPPPGWKVHDAATSVSRALFTRAQGLVGASGAAACQRYVPTACHFLPGASIRLRQDFCHKTFAPPIVRGMH